MFKKNKFVIVLLMCFFILAFTACNNNNDTNKNDTTTPTENVTSAETETKNDITDDALKGAGETPTVEVSPTENITPEADITPTEEPVITDEPEATEHPTPMVDPAQSENTHISTILATYYDYICNGVDIPEEDKLYRLRYGLAFIDDDEIPELLIANNNNHGTGVRVIFYNDGDLKEVGSFGSYGGFAYVKHENRVISFYMGYGAITTTVYHINPDFTLTTEIDCYQDDDGNCTLNGEPSNYEDNEAELDKAIESTLGNKRILVDYETLLLYDDTNDSDKAMGQLEIMLQKLSDPDFESFSEDEDETVIEDDPDLDLEVYHLKADLERNEYYDYEDKLAFTAKEYLWVSPKDTELIKEYGLPEDLDGYDYEIVNPDHDPYIIFLDKSTDITFIDFSDGIEYKKIDLDEFAKKEYYSGYDIGFKDLSPDGDFNGQTAVRVYEEYFG